MRAILILLKMELSKYFYRPLSLVFTLFIFASLILLNNLLFNNSYAILLGGKSVVEFMLPPLIFTLIILISFNNVAKKMARGYSLNAINRFNYINITRFQYLFVLFLTSLIIITLIASVTFIVCYFIFKLTFPSFGVIIGFFFAIALITFAFTSFAILIASVFKDLYLTYSLIFILNIFFIFGTSSVVPFPVLPQKVQDIIQYIPFTHMVNLLKNIWSIDVDTAFYLSHLLNSVLITLLFFLSAVVNFKWNKH